LSLHGVSKEYENSIVGYGFDGTYYTSHGSMVDGSFEKSLWQSGAKS
jgi:hypothetical protein